MKNMVDELNSSEIGKENKDEAKELAQDTMQKEFTEEKIESEIHAEENSAESPREKGAGEPEELASEDEVKDDHVKKPEVKDTEDNNVEEKTPADPHAVTLEKVQAVLNQTADKSSLSPQIQRMMQRQAEDTRRVEDSIKGTKSNPSWFVPLFCTLMVVGLLWAVVYYLQGTYPIPGIGNWNLLIAFIIILIGFIMTMWWR